MLLRAEAYGAQVRLRMYTVALDEDISESMVVKKHRPIPCPLATPRHTNSCSKLWPEIGSQNDEIIYIEGVWTVLPGSMTFTVLSTAFDAAAAPRLRGPVPACGTIKRTLVRHQQG